MEEIIQLSDLGCFVGNKAPVGDGKKHYAVGCYSAEDWQYIHELLMQDGTLEDNIPCDCIECSDLKEHSETRAVYLLTDDEANQLRNHPKVKYVHYDSVQYPGEFPQPEPFAKYLRYSEKEKQYRNWWNNASPLTPITNPTSVDINRSGYNILRATEKEDLFWGQGFSGTVLHNDKIEYYGDGTDVDVIVGDEGCWIGHPEFSSKTGNGPVNYVGKNVICGVGSTATCDVLDLVLDAPYYIDPAWFDASPGTRLTTRWDGTKVPVESVARSWWSNASQRSSQFSSVGTINVNSNYTRAGNLGSNTELPTISTNHGTQCAALAFGRTQGWAFNANKWVVNVYGTYGPTDRSLGTENYLDMMKLFHQNKPVNPKYGTKDPTISSNSFGQGITYNPSVFGLETAFYFYRGSAGVGFTNGTTPGFMQCYAYTPTVGNQVNGKFEYVGNSMTDAGDEMIAAGVIFCAAAGNSAQKLVGSAHSDYNNYWGNTSNATLTTQYAFGSSNIFLTTNRIGWPAHLGKFSENGNVVYPGIIVGALDARYQISGLERKVDYSERGEAVDFYFPADGTMTAGAYSNSSGTRFDLTNSVKRPDTYVGLGTTACDVYFNGTSSACPGSAGLIATKLQYNRNWTWRDVKNWIKGTNQPVGVTTVGFQSSTRFYYGSESTTATSSNWTDKNSLEGGSPIILWDAPTGKEIDVTNLSILS